MEDKLVISLLMGRKFSFEEKKTFFVGIVTQTLYDTVRFERNTDLSIYLEPFEKQLNNAEPFKDYLYKSRPLLAARIARLLFNNTDRNITNLLINAHIDYISKNVDIEKASTKPSNKHTSNLLEDILKERQSK